MTCPFIIIYYSCSCYEILCLLHNNDTITWVAAGRYRYYDNVRIIYIKK